MDDSRPDPDALLASVRREEERARGGRLWVFFGMAAGVGKTFAMLRSAQNERAKGIDVVIGLVETHKRVETEALLAGLPRIPLKKIAYRGVTLEEMDLDAILAHKPQLVLVDELAHTNVPGSRHPKRWHDVGELLDAGIDVYSTLNVQHIESRKETVESIAGITVRETVPDTILERASQVILIDITPAELLKRLHDGKVYLGDMAEAAAHNFFQEDRLTALREIALRMMAEKVDSQLHGLIDIQKPETAWKPSERLMVAVSHSPHSEDLIRATRRLAFSLGAPWIAVNVDTGLSLNTEDRQQLAQNLALARELGGEVVSVTDVDVVEALLRIAGQQNITQLVAGHPIKRWFRDLLSGGTPLDRLARQATTFDIHILKPERTGKHPPRRVFRFTPESSLIRYWFMLWVFLAVSVASAALLPLIGYRAVGFVFLLGVLTVGLFVSIGPTIFAALLAAVTWDYFFIPPAGTFHISQPEDVAMCLALLVSASVTGVLASRIRRRERLIRSREQRTNALYQIASAISGAGDRRAFASAVTGNLDSLLHGEMSIALKKADGQLEHISSGYADYWMTAEKEWIVASWAFRHRKAAGYSTDTLASAAAWYIPLIGPTETVGVLAYKPKPDTRLSHDEENLLLAVARQLAVATERELFQERSRQMQQLAESERLYHTILNSVSHELRTPLTAIVGNASALLNDQIASNPHNRQQLSEEIVKSAARLNRVVSNLLDMSRLRSGTLSLKRDWHEVDDLIAVTLDSQRTALADHHVVVRTPENLPLIGIDFQLMEQALANLLINAAAYTPAQTTIEIAARTIGSNVELTVSDSGPGVPEESIAHLFEMFYRVPGSPAGGTGIGLTIVKGIVEAHGGLISARNRPEGGACFIIRLPLEQQPQVLDDTGES